MGSLYFIIYQFISQKQSESTFADTFNEYGRKYINNTRNRGNQDSAKLVNIFSLKEEGSLLFMELSQVGSSDLQ